MPKAYIVDVAVSWIEDNNINPVKLHKKLGTEMKRKIWNLKETK